MTYQRIESSTINPELADPLSCAVADPLWFLGRQWQVGELQGEDGGRPVALSIESRRVRADHLRGGNSSSPRGDFHRLDDGPLEPQVEREPLLDTPGQLMWSARLGAQVLRLLTEAGASASSINDLRKQFDLPTPSNLRPVDRVLCSEGLDGLSLVRAILAGKIEAPAKTAKVLTRFATSVREQYDLDGAGQANPSPETWDPERQEYQFHLSSEPQEKPTLRLDAPEYHGRRADWFSFDVEQADGFHERLAAQKPTVDEVLASEINIGGAPDQRWWAIEGDEVSIAHLQGSDTDLARAVVAGFVTTFGNDWLMAPVPAQLGDIVEISSVSVIDSFGTPTPVPPIAARDHGETPKRPWKFFELTGDTGPAKGRAPLLYLTPTATDLLAGPDLERVVLAHDEVSNLGWAIEEVVEGPFGRPRERSDADDSSVPAESGSGNGMVYRLDPVIPEHWIPLIAVQRTGDTQRWRQRARATPPEGAPSGWGRARGRLLEPEDRLLLHEEEIPRAGSTVIRRLRAGRRHDGTPIVWPSRRKRLGGTRTTGSYLPDQMFGTPENGG